MNPEVDSEFVLRYYGERSAFFITGSVFYVLHALLYIFPRVIYCVEPNEADRLERNKNRSFAYVSGISRCVMSACFLSGAGYFFSSETEKILYNTEDRAASFILIGTVIFGAAVATDQRVFKPDPTSIFGIIIMLVVMLLIRFIIFPSPHSKAWRVKAQNSTTTQRPLLTENWQITPCYGAQEAPGNHH